MATTEYVSTNGSSDFEEPQTFWIPPLQHIEAQSIALPPPDQVGIAVVQPCIHCFLTTESFDEQRFIEGVKIAAGCVPWEIPLMAGRIVWDDESRHRIKVDIPREPKIEVRFKRLPNRDAKKLDAQHWPPHALQLPEICLSDRPLPGVGAPVFGIQVNLVKGGIILVLHLNHILFDGGALTTFYGVFAHHLGRAMAGKSPQKSGIMPPQALDKSHARGSQPARNILEWEDWRLKPQINITPEQMATLFYQRLAKLSFTIWHIPPEKLQKLRTSMQKNSQSKLSLATCLSTWFWKVFARARNLPLETETKMIMPVQTRGKIKELHPSYIGSAFVYGRAKATVAELSSLTTNELGDRIAKSVAWWTPEKIREHWGSIDACDDLAKYEANTNRDFGTDIEMSNIANFPLWNHPWGEGLVFRAHRFPGLAFTDGWILIHPRLPSGGFEVLVYSARDTLDKLMKDVEFREYAEYWCASDQKIDVQAAETMPNKARL